MDAQQYKDLIKDLVDIMKQSGLDEIEIRENDFEIHLRRASAAPPAPAAPVHAVAPAQPGAPIPATPEPPDEEAGLVPIKSPMVGTFYMAPAPDADPFVSEGDTVEPDSVVCIVEAMKVMNEIKAETSGRIARIVCENGQAVEFGQTLFLIEPL
jgi:acetyl-CoA carboxylase biotin carboxyl carrier protein